MPWHGFNNLIDQLMVLIISLTLIGADQTELKNEQSTFPENEKCS